MSPMNTKKAISMTRLLRVVVVAMALLLTSTAFAAAPGITGLTFNLQAQTAFITQPDGQMVYSWGYGCSGTQPSFSPSMPGAICPTMQIPGPTLIVTEGQTVTVNLTNNLPAAAGKTSILFPGFTVLASGGSVGVLTREAATGGGTVSYQFSAGSPGTRAYYSGSQGDLQVEMGLYGAIIVLPNATPAVTCPTHNSAAGVNVTGTALVAGGELDYRLSPTHAAYHVAESCYDREYLFQFSEMDPKIHRAAEEIATCVPGPGKICAVNMDTVATEPYHPAYFMINGRSMPDDMDPNYAPEYPHQPYNGNPHMHPGELVLLRIVGTGRWQHPFHEHGNHVRILARDGNLILSQSDATNTKLAGPLLFTTTTTPGLAMDGIFYWTGKGLNWDAYGHGYPGDPSACSPDANGYYTSNLTALNYYEFCQDHTKPLETHPFGEVADGGPATLPDANILTNGAWYGGSPYLGPAATSRATFGNCATNPGPPATFGCGTTGSTPPSGTIANPPGSEAGFAFMWHSHNEREITTNNIFPGGMLMMMLVDSREFPINESF